MMPEDKQTFPETDGPKTISVPVAGKLYFDLAKNAAYAAAKRGEIPTIRVGRKLRVPIVLMDRKMLGAT